MDAVTKLKRSDNVAFQTVAGEAILIRLDTGTYFSLNKIGTEFWEMLDGQRTIEQHAMLLANKSNQIVQSAVAGLNELAEKISKEYDAEAEVLVDDIREFAHITAKKYHVDVSTVVGDLLELAQKMAAGKLVDVV